MRCSSLAVLLGVLWASAQAISAETLKIHLVVSVDWEGDSLDAVNLEAMRDFRARFPEIPLLQFLNAAYFTQPGADAADVRSKIAALLRPGDELGIHIHPYRHLVEASGVPVRDRPSLSPRDAAEGCGVTCGGDVPLFAYTIDELRMMIRFSRSTLERHGFGRARSFRAGAWLARTPVLEALAAEGILWDSSAVPARFLGPGDEGSFLYQWVRETWPDTDVTTQPYAIRTARGEIMELPDNGVMADYTTEAQMLEIFEDASSVLERSGAHEAYLQYGFHLETAAEYLPRFSRGLTAIQARAVSKGITLNPVVLPSWNP